MPNRVFQFLIWERLRRRFNLEGINPIGTKLLSDTIIPVTDADALLDTPLVQDVTDLDLNAAGAGVYSAAFTVPDGRQWRLLAAHREATTGGSAIWVQISGDTGFLGVLGTGEAVYQGNPIFLNAADSIGMRGTGNAADTAIQLNCIIMEQEVFE